MTSVLPGSTLGIFGGGQLGRMTALAARSMGYHIQVLDPDPHCATSPVADRTVTGRFDDPDAAASLARECDVLTLEIEQISRASLEAAARYAPVRPGPEVIEVVQDRARQKDWLSNNGFPVGPYVNADSAEALERAVQALGGRVFAKAYAGGYDGRGQVQVHAAAESRAAWLALGERRVVVERELDLAAEISVLTARRPGGEYVVYPPAMNHHERGQLDWSMIPAPPPARTLSHARELAASIAEALKVEGLLAVEMFLLHDGALLVNELAPRPHNSFHHTDVACQTSQFEQAVRAACDLPLGSTKLVRPAALANLFGDLWLAEHPPAFDAALRFSGVRLHLYGKQGARAARKMGHLTATAESPAEALELVLEARKAIAAEQ